MKGVFEPRIVRGYSILAKGDEPQRLDEQTFVIPSQSGNGKYLVRSEASKWRCTCPDHTYRNVECKHIHAVKFWLALKRKMDEEGVFDFHNRVREKPSCVYCGSPDVVKNGNRRSVNGDKQRFWCKTCNRTFIQDNSFERNPKIISLALDLYFKGVSLRKVVDHLNQFYGIKVHHSTVLRWIQKYTKIINRYVKKLEPQLSDTWNVDEMMVKCKDGGWNWLWNVMDEETRFLLASLISNRREIEDARKVFVKAKSIARGKPDFVITDGLRAYQDAFKKEFFTLKNPRTKHIRLASLRNKISNNLVERLQGTIRERDKVMRGFDTDETAQILIEGLRAYYNFIRPHMGLNGLTPAEVAGIDLELGRNRWLSLIKKSLNQPNCTNQHATT